MMNRRAVALSLALLCGSALFAEGAFPYALDPVKDSAWVVGDLGLYGASLYLDGKKRIADSPSLDESKIPFFDALYATSHSAALGTAADFLVVAFAGLPAVALPGLDAKETLTVGAMYGETLGLAYSLDALIKSLVVRYRPYAYSSPPPPDIGSLDITSSFPSRHATLAFASAVFAATVYDQLQPGSRYRGAVWAGGLGAATLISSLRVASGDHFVSDVAAGAALGALVGFAVPYLHKVEGGAGGSSGSGKSLDAPLGGLFFDLRLAP
jgi:membrane-associated phospholipid phosphatase